jgi:hypothetical protein
VLHAILREHLETFLAEREASGQGLPGFVVDELRDYLRCGVLAMGAARFLCDHCGRERLCALSCKGRGFCPRCLGRRMTELARHWVVGVLPRVRVRQWVLSLPFALRLRLAFHHDLALRVHAVMARAIESRYRARARSLGERGGRGGSVTVIQRFGSDLRLNVHFHLLALDGVFVDEPGGGRRFVTIAAPTHDEMHELLAVIVKRITLLLDSRGLADHDAIDDDAAALAAAARSVRGAGAAQHAPDDHAPDDTASSTSRLKARIDQFDLDASTEVGHRRRDRLEPLCRYLLRPPLADRRLRDLGNAHIALELKTPWSNGTKWITMPVTIFLERLCSLVPRPRKNTILYRGVLAAHAKDRARVVPRPDLPGPRNTTWCELMKHGLGVDVLACPCGARMRHVATVLSKDGLARLLRAHGYPDRALPIRPARAPPQAELFGA